MSHRCKRCKTAAFYFTTKQQPFASELNIYRYTEGVNIREDSKHPGRVVAFPSQYRNYEWVKALINARQPDIFGLEEVALARVGAGTGYLTHAELMGDFAHLGYAVHSCPALTIRGDVVLWNYIGVKDSAGAAPSAGHEVISEACEEQRCIAHARFNKGAHDIIGGASHLGKRGSIAANQALQGAKVLLKAVHRHISF